MLFGSSRSCRTVHCNEPPTDATLLRLAEHSTGGYGWYGLQSKVSSCDISTCALSLQSLRLSVVVHPALSNDCQVALHNSNERLVCAALSALQPACMVKVVGREDDATSHRVERNARPMPPDSTPKTTVLVVRTSQTRSLDVWSASDA